jgi:DNA-binding protein HU-beta
LASTLNKPELIQAVAEKTGLKKADAGAAVNALVAAITDALKNGDKVQLTGFGSFEVRRRAARMARNPQKPDEAVEVPSTNAPAFKASKTLKDILNG